ncbi:MAG: hypothetical protein QW228_05220 [Candidatus Aenigmatarchaeota archaeon]
MKYPKQVVGNLGLYYVCYELSKRGWNVMPTSRNTKGVDIVVYSQNYKRKYTIQVKSLRKKDNVRLGSNLENLCADFLIICVNLETTPEIFITKVSELKKHNNVSKYVSKSGKGRKRIYYIKPTKYKDFKNWRELENGF